MADSLRVGAYCVPLATARTWVEAYFDEAANEADARPYAYPFYDHMSTGSNPNELNDGDFLAPTLLNVRMSIAAFRSLQSVRGQLEAGLSAIPPGLVLEDAVTEGRHAELLAGLFGVLDDGALRGVKLTTLTKVLHRKRPAFVPLYDSHVRACYIGTEANHPISEAAYETIRWVDVISRLAECVTNDLASQGSVWTELAAGVTVSKLRILDVVAWRAGG